MVFDHFRENFGMEVRFKFFPILQGHILKVLTNLTNFCNFFMHLQSQEFKLPNLRGTEIEIFLHQVRE